MLNEVTRHVQSAISKALAGRQPLTRSELSQAQLPPAIHNYMDAVLDHEAERVADAIKDRRDPWIAENAEVSRARTALAVAASRSIQIPGDRLNDLVKEAAATVVRYLVRPARTLVEEVFEDDRDEIRVDEAVDRMAALRAYGYFDDVLRHYFAEKDIERVDRARLDSVLHRVDRQMTSDFTTDEWLEISAPLFQTLAFASPYRDGVPAELLRMYFREKEAGVVLERLEDLERGELISRDRLRDLLDAPLVEEEVVEEPEPTPAKLQSELPFTAPSSRHERRREDEAVRRPHTPADVPTPSQPIDEGPVPLWKQFQSRPASAQPQRPQQAAPKQQPSQPPQDLPPGTPLWQRYRSPAPSETPPAKPESRRETQRHTENDERRSPRSQATTSEVPLESIEHEVLGGRGQKNRRMFVRQIFGGDSDAYRDALVEISEVKTWSEASRFIAREVFMRHDVNIYDDAAVAFTDLIEERFAERQRA